MSKKSSGRGWILQTDDPGASIDSQENAVIPQLELSDLNQQTLSPCARGRGRLMEYHLSNRLTPCVESGGTSRGRLIKSISEFSTKPTSQLEQPKEEGFNQQRLTPPARGRGRLMEYIFSIGPTPCVTSGETSRERFMKSISELSTKPTNPYEVSVLNDHKFPLNKKEVIGKPNEDIKKSCTVDELKDMVSNTLSIGNKTEHTKEQSSLPVLSDHKPLSLIRKCLDTTGTIIKFSNVVNLQNWMVIHSENDPIISDFIKQLEKQFRLIAVNITRPTIKHIQSYQVEDYIKVLKDNIGQGVQLVVCIVNGRNKQVFSAIKMICYDEMEIHSQIILNSTLSQVFKKYIMQNIAMQIKYKLGGSIWTVKIPPMSAMFVGIHSYDRNVITIAASINTTCTHWYCKGILQNRDNEKVTEICSSLIFALIEYQNNKNYLPEKIVILRTGVKNGQENFDAAYEILQIQRVCATSFDNYNPKITFIVIQRNLFGGTNSNPIANTFTQEYRYDFSLNWKRPQNKPDVANLFGVVHDDSDFSPAFLKNLIKKLSTQCIDLPFNEPIPVCCLYAKMAAKRIASSLQYLE